MKYFGSGGDDGGDSQSLVESPDTLVAKQYLRIVDLVSEGPIVGPVNGLQSVYIAGTPVQNQDGSKNVSGFSINWRNGTQSQSYIPGFEEVESEHAVGVHVKKGFPATRTMESSDVDSVRISVSVPALYATDTSSGSTYPTDIALQISVQNNGGGFIPQAIGYKLVTSNATSSGVPASQYFTQTSNTYASTSTITPKVGIFVTWTGTASANEQRVGYNLQQSVQGSGTWTTIASREFVGKSKTTEVVHGTPPNYGYIEYVTTPPTDTFFQYVYVGDVKYDYRIVVTSNNGTNEPKFDVNKFEAFTRDFYDRISGKATSKFVKEYRIALTGTGPWDVRVTRLTDDSTSAYLKNDMYWESYTEIIESKLSYPNSAYVAMSVDASQYDSIPDRAYHIKGRIVSVPANYDPVTRIYTGDWNFLDWKQEYTDNPVWCFYDLCTNTRYGLGSYFEPSNLNLTNLYKIAKYCDEFVSDGYGGTEPRFTCSLYLQGRTDVYKILNDMVSIFGGMVYWADGGISATCDMPTNPAWSFTNANVIDGVFTYQGSSKNTRHTVALVTYRDRNDRFAEKVEYVDDPEGILRYGVKPTSIVAVGATSRGQAHRYGKNILLSEQYLTEVVTFKTGLEGAATGIGPGSVIKILDADRAGVRWGGRVISATSSSITLDSSVTLEAGTTYTLSLIKPDGSIGEHTVTTGAGTTNVLSVNPSFGTNIPQVMSIWILQSNTLSAELFRVVSIKEDGVLFEISALAYNPTKYAAIEQGLKFVVPQTTTGDLFSITPPTGLYAEESTYIANDGSIVTAFDLSVDKHPSRFFSNFRLYWRYKNSGASWIRATDFYSTSTTVENTGTGDIEFYVEAVSQLQKVSTRSYGEVTISGKRARPPNVTGFKASVHNGTAFLSWDSIDSPLFAIDYYTIRFSPSLTPQWGSSTALIDKVSFPLTNTSCASMQGSYLIKAVDKAGNSSLSPTIIINTVANIDNYNVIETIVSDPYYPEEKINVVSAGGKLYLNGSPMSEWIPIEIAVPLSRGSRVHSQGEYFIGSIDLSEVYSVRMTPIVEAFGRNYSSRIGDWPSLKEVSSLVGVDSDKWRVDILYRVKNKLEDSWSNWKVLNISEDSYRYAEFKAVLTSLDENTTPVVNKLRIALDMPDRVDGREDVECPAYGLRVTYEYGFKDNPAVAIVAQDLQTGDYYEVSDKDQYGFYILFKDFSGKYVTRTFDWVAKGYGYSYGVDGSNKKWIGNTIPDSWKT